MKPKTKYLYIPIWLYSNATGAKLGAATGALYIPIWLYSNGLISAISRTPFDFTFQSGYIPIMLKQIPIVRIHTLYIPIWLYSNGTAFSLSISIIYPLHSNLVIFQLAIAVSPLLYLTSFTFQSGYIPMVGMIGKRRILKDFTFQSGYIPILYIIFFCNYY